MRAKEYDLMSRCVEDGITRGYHRAFKHTENPDPAQIIESIRVHVMGEICDAFTFEDLPQEES